MRLKLVKRPGKVTQIVDDDTGEQVEGVTSVHYAATVAGAKLTVVLADFAVDVLSDEEILNVVSDERPPE